MIHCNNKQKVGIVFLCLCLIVGGYAATKTSGTTSGVKASSNSTVKVTSVLKVNNGSVTVSDNAKLEGVTNLTNSTLNKNNGINATIKSGTVTNGSSIAVSNSTVNLGASTVSQPIAVSGNATLEGVPKNFTTAASNGIALANSSTTLNVAVTSPIATNIALAGGTVALQGTTKLADGKSISGPGTVNCSGNSLQLGGTPVTVGSKLTIKKGADIQFYSTLTVTGELLFDGDANVCGNGNTLDISSGGTIAIRSGTTVSMTNLLLKGLGIGKIMLYDKTSKLNLASAEVMLNRSYTVTTGGIYVAGPTVITTANNILNFSLLGTLTVDGVTLLYDTLVYPDSKNILPQLQNDPNHKNLALLNNGTIGLRIGKLYTTNQEYEGLLTSVVQNNHCVFHKGNTGVRGIVRLGGGFTVLPDASVDFDSCLSVSGPIDLRETGTLILVDDISLGSNVTLSSGGGIYGNGRSVILDGNLTLPANKIMHIMSDTIIDGRGHALTVGDFGQLFVDNSVTLTLQNMVLKSGQKTAVFPPVRCSTATSKLALDNVLIEPQSDIPFYQGQLFIHNNVVFTGTSVLIYQSPQTSFITSGATLLFDKSTTFSYAPATTSKDLMQLQDATSRIVFDGATLKCTDTGMRLTTGRLLCDNKVVFDSLGGNVLTTLTTVTGGYYKKAMSTWGKCRWSSSGRYFALVADADSSAKIYSFDATTNPPTIIQRASAAYAATPYALDWSPDGRYVAIGGSPDGSQLVVYSWNGTTVTQVVTVTVAFAVYTIAWSPDGKYLSVGGSSTSPSLQVFKFNGVSLISVASVTYNNTIYNQAWHPSGNYLAIAGYDGNEVKVYRFTGSSLSLVATQGSLTKQRGVSWSPDGRYLAVGGENNTINVYSFDGTTLTSAANVAYPTNVRALRWSPDGKMLAAVGAETLIRTYIFTGSTLVASQTADLTAISPAPTSSLDCAWHPTGQFILTMDSDSGGGAPFHVLSVGYTPPTIPQALTNSIVFGNAALSNADLNVQILSGGRVEIRGQVLDDSAP